jgi:hypothetical protein
VLRGYVRSADLFREHAGVAFLELHPIELDGAEM